jgi:hypothetical protein
MYRPMSRGGDVERLTAQGTVDDGDTVRVLAGHSVAPPLLDASVNRLFSKGTSTLPMSSEHYALVSRSERLVFSATTPDDTATSGTSTVHRSTTTATSSSSEPQNDTIRAELTELYQAYADLYPNPHLAEEARERDTLLQATSAAVSANQRESLRPKKVSKKRGFFASLFGGGSGSTTHGGGYDAQTESATSTGDQDDPLIYTDIGTEEQSDNEQIKNNNNDNDFLLCGTTQSLDTSCIPEEAYTVARFHLTSTRTRRGDQPNAVRRLSGSASSISDTSRSTAQRSSKMESAKRTVEKNVSLVVVGLGCIAEFPSGVGETNHSANPRILSTSDRDDLLTYATTTSNAAAASTTSSRLFRLEQVRASTVGPNCLAVSWGFEDGLVVFYRRLEMPCFPDDTPDDGEDYLVGWQAVWMLGASRPVMENMADVFQQDDDDAPGSPLLRVSDMLPFIVAAPKSDDSSRPPFVATLAIGRLGGYMELVPLPTSLWYGEEIALDDKRRTQMEEQLKVKSKGKRKRRQGQHYAVGSSIQVGTRDQTVALTTLDYHIDIMCLEAFRTQVMEDTEWDTQAFPDSPPAEFVLAATGTSKQHGQETLTFWAVSTIFTDEAAASFHVHAVLIEALTASSGAGVSIFATPAIMKRWRKKRNVQLREDAGLAPGMLHTAENKDQPLNTSTNQRVTTISASAPIVSMRFVKSNGVGPFLALLDWNGCATIMDCSMMAKLASQTLSQLEYDLYRNTSHHMPFPLATTVVTRTHVAEILRRHSGHPKVCVTLPASCLVINLHWLSPSLSASKIGMLPPLILLMGSPKRQLYIVSFEIQDSNDESGNRKGAKSSVTSLRLPARGASMETLDEGQVSFVSVGHQSKRKRQSATNHDRSLSFFVMQRLQPLAIIESLARAGKHEEAIKAARTLSEAEQLEISELIHDCRRRLWERNGDVDSLANTADAQYIVQEAVTICRQTSASQVKGGVDNLEKVRSICCLALDQSKSYQPENDNNDENAFDVIKRYLVSLGTYEILCRHFSAEPSFRRFLEEFFGLPVLDLAAQFARTADLLALSTVYFRHARDLLRDSVDVLDMIPLSVDPASYCHLFPIIREDGTRSDCFLSSSNSDHPPLHWSHMPQYLEEMEGHTVVLDRRDEAMVLDLSQQSLNENVEAEDKNNGLSSSVADWFSSRANKMQTFVGPLPPVVLFCEMGLRCTVASPVNESSMLGYSKAIQKLYKTWRSACSLHKMLAEGVVALNAGSDGVVASQSVDAVNINDILSMELVDIVALVLHGETDKDEILSRHTNYLQPLLMNITFASGSDLVDASANLDEAVASYCTSLVGGIAEIDKENDAELVGYAVQALAACAAIAACSATLNSKWNRLIKNKKVLCDMVLTSIHESAMALKDIVIPPDENREIISSLWKLYEALPVHIPAAMPLAESWVPLLEKVDSIFQDLVGVDLLSRWPGCRPFAFYFKMQNARYVAEHESKQLIVDVGIDTIQELCRSFCSQVHYGMVLEDNLNVARLLDLVSDLEQLHDVCFSATLPIALALCEHLLRPLLQQELFHIVAGFLSKAPPAFVESDQVTRVVLAYVDEAVFTVGTENTKIMAAIRCQDVIGPAFPVLHSSFFSVRRYLDAANFINTVICDGEGEATPSNLRLKLPLDVVESILAENPSRVACGCLQWTDHSYALKANKMLRENHSYTVSSPENQPDVSKLPTLPGGAIFHLATILGLEDGMSAVVVKCRVSHYAMINGWYGAAAAICRTLVCEKNESSLGNVAETRAKLHAVAEVVAEERYIDILTRHELCNATLQKFRGKVSFYNSSAFDAIVRACALLDQQTSLFSRARQDLYRESNPADMHHAVARLYRDIQSEYKADVHALFSDLQSQTSQGLVHDSLMNALCRFVIYWSISDSVRLKSLIDDSEKADAGDILALGCALILSTPSTDTAIMCARDLLNIATDQATKVASEERFGAATTLCRPDSQIVEYLVGHGYGENGARRATAMTQNSGLDAALAWAMTHSDDDKFNDPIVVLKTPNHKYIDEGAIQALQKSLLATKNFLEAEGSIDRTLRSLALMRRTVTEDRTMLPLDMKTSEESYVDASADSQDVKARSPSGSTKLHPSPAISSPSSTKMVEPSPPALLPTEALGNVATRSTRAPPSPPSPQSPAQVANNTNTGHSESNPNSLPKQLNQGLSRGAYSKSVPKSATDSLKPFSPATINLPVKPPPSVNKLPLKGDVTLARAIAAPSPRLSDADAVPTAGKSPSRSAATTEPHKPHLSREQLRKRGEAALVRLRVTTSKTASITSDRKRLMEEGRKLLKFAKSKSPASAAVVSGPPRPFEQHHQQSPRAGTMSTMKGNVVESLKRELVLNGNSLEVESHTHEIPLQQDRHQQQHQLLDGARVAFAPEISDSSSSSVLSTIEHGAVNGINGGGIMGDMNGNSNTEDGPSHDLNNNSNTEDVPSQNGWDFEW